MLIAKNYTTLLRSHYLNTTYSGMFSWRVSATRIHVSRMKGFTLLFLLAVACLSQFLFFVSSTAASTGWSRIYQGGLYDAWIPYSAIQTNDGGYAMAVFSNAAYVDNVGYTGHFTKRYELYLIKMDSFGNVQWNYTFAEGDPNFPAPGDAGYTLVQTTDGAYAVAGTTGNSQFWLFKVGSQGSLLWSKNYVPASEVEGGSSDFLSSMVQTGDGGFVLAGATEAFTATTGGGRDFWLVKVDSQGSEQWNQTYNSGTYMSPTGDVYPREDEGRCVFQTNDGGYVMAGQTTTYSSLSSTYEVWVVKTDASGKVQWANKYAGSSAPGLEYRVVQTNDGGFAVAGTELISAENTDFYLIKTNSQGEVQWRKTYGEKYEDWAFSLLRLDDGGLAIGGTMTEVGTTGPISRDFGLLRVDSSGNKVWSRMYNAREDSSYGKSSETEYSMFLTSDGSYAIVGSTVSGWDGSHVDVFFVKTESLEQPPEPSQSQSFAISDLSGSVKMLVPAQGDNWTQANNGASVSEGNKIKTEEDAGTLKLAGTTKIEMQPNTLIVIGALTNNSGALVLQSGEFTAEVTGLPLGGSVKVDMSQAIAEIKGTVFTVTETGTESTLSVKEGSVVFTSKSDGKTVTVEAGQKVTATAAGLGSTPPQPVTSDSSTLIIAIAVIVIVVFVGLAVLAIRRKRSRAILS